MSVGNGLAMVCDIRISNNGPNGYYSTILNNNLMKGMACNKAEVFKQAMADSWKNNPPVFQSMETKMFGSNKADNLLYDGNHVTEIAPMYVLTNETCVLGAAVLFYPDIQDKISEFLGEGYYALPSSIHQHKKNLKPKMFNSSTTAISTVTVLSVLLKSFVIKRFFLLLAKKIGAKNQLKISYQI